MKRPYGYCSEPAAVVAIFMLISEDRPRVVICTEQADVQTHPLLSEWGRQRGTAVLKHEFPCCELERVLPVVHENAGVHSGTIGRDVPLAGTQGDRLQVWRCACDVHLQDRLDCPLCGPCALK